ncbi:MAG: hypothetical protein ABR981_01720 [Candidatus Micrarchaeaceae archaeon]|jgi:hypothetical protein
MPKSLVGRVKNKNFAFFWLLIGGSIGNILLTFYSISAWMMLLPSAVLSILIAILMMDKTKRPKIWLGIDLILTCILLIFLVPFLGTSRIELASFLPGVLIILGCIIGIMNW